jgi:beta-phosphoglucomutase-like phosphatase (HAD superfamily)
MHALIFDLDGTLIDTVYAHVFSWQRAFEEAGMAIDGWRIHRRIGMSGGLFARAVAFSGAMARSLRNSHL